MKPFKLIMAVIAVLLFSNFLFAGNPKTSGEDNLADLLIAKMGNDVVLTDSQKVVVKKKLKKYIVKMQNAHALSKNDEKFTQKKQATDEYQFSLDSILTPSQREQLNIKIKERENTK